MDEDRYHMLTKKMKVVILVFGQGTIQSKKVSGINRGLK